MNRDLPSMAGFANNKRERTTKGTIKITKRHKKLRKPFCAFFEFALCLLCTSFPFSCAKPRGRGFALRLFAGRNCAELQRAWKNLPAIREGKDISGRIVRTVFRPKSLNHDCFADFQCVFGKSFSDGHPWRQTRKAPRRRIAFFILHVDVEPDVWIHPLDLLDDTADLDRLGGVELCCLRVMRNERRCGE